MLRQIFKLIARPRSRFGAGTKIWQYTVILPKASIGNNCNICSHVFIENLVTIGNSVTIKNGCKLYDGCRIYDNCFIGPNVIFANDLYPRSKEHLDDYLLTEVLEGASIGAGSVVLPGITIGRRALVGAGSVVTTDIPDDVVAFGNPARVIRSIKG